jgi:transposase
MNSHKNARLTFARRIELVREMTSKGLAAGAAGLLHGVSATTATKWLGRFLALGEAGLADRSSRPKLSPAAISPQRALAIIELRRRRLTHASIARALAVSKSTVGRVLRRAGLSKLSDLLPAEPVKRYEHEAPGDMVHIDTKKLGRITRPSHRVTGNHRDSVDGSGWEYLFVAVDDHSRIAFTDVYPDERKPAPSNSCAIAWPITPAWACAFGGCSLITVQPSAQIPGDTHVVSWESAIPSPPHIDRRQTARPSVSSSRHYASGPIRGSTRTPRRERKFWTLGFTTTTGTAPTKALAGKPPCRDSAARQATS